MANVTLRIPYTINNREIGGADAQQLETKAWQQVQNAQGTLENGVLELPKGTEVTAGKDAQGGDTVTIGKGDPIPKAVYDRWVSQVKERRDPLAVENKAVPYPGMNADQTQQADARAWGLVQENKGTLDATGKLSFPPEVPVSFAANGDFVLNGQAIPKAVYDRHVTSLEGGRRVEDPRQRGSNGGLEGYLDHMRTVGFDGKPIYPNGLDGKPAELLRQLYPNGTRNDELALNRLSAGDQDYLTRLANHQGQGSLPSTYQGLGELMVKAEYGNSIGPGNSFSPYTGPTTTNRIVTDKSALELQQDARRDLAQRDENRWLEDKRQAVSKSINEMPGNDVTREGLTNYLASKGVPPETIQKFQNDIYDKQLLQYATNIASYRGLKGSQVSIEDKIYKSDLYTRLAGDKANVELLKAWPI